MEVTLYKEDFRDGPITNYWPVLAEMAITDGKVPKGTKVSDIDAITVTVIRAELK